MLRFRGGEQRATRVELFFDLVFVFAITQLSALLISDISFSGAARVLFLLLVVWWAWIYTTWMTNWFDPVHLSVRLVLIACMLAAFLMAIAIPDAFGERAALFAGGACDAVAAWRGAFLAHGSLTEPGRSSALEITCPGMEAAMALVGAARRLGVAAKAREVRGADRVVVRDGDAIGALLTRIGAHSSVLQWEERRMRREVRATANRLANFDDANLRRSVKAAVTASARVNRALELLGDEVPDHLITAGRLRVEHEQASLEELGQLADPPMTKDAVAGRIRRLLAMADKKAKDMRVPDTASAVSEDMEEDEELVQVPAGRAH